MMGHSKAQKAATRDRIVEIAAVRLREAGLDGLSIADLMKEAGLTHGGFYKHFDSRDSLVAAAMEVALRNGRERPASVPEVATKTRDFRDVVTEYVSTAHRDAIGTGCAVSALVTDVPRATEATRALFTSQVKANFEVLGRLLSEDASAERRAKAIVALSAMVGSIGLARAVNDEPLSDEILKAVQTYLVDEL